MKEKSIEVLVLSNVPNDSRAATLLKARIESGDVAVHPSYADEIMAKLEDAIAGKLVASGAGAPDENAIPFEFCLTESGLTKGVKSISIGEIENALAEFFTSKCETPVSVSINRFAQDTGGRFYSPEYEISMSFKVASKT